MDRKLTCALPLNQAGLIFAARITFQLRMTLLATGRFLTIFTTSALKFSAQRSELKILPVELPAMRFPNGIVTLKNRTLGPVARLFIETAREVAKSLAQRK